MLCFHKSFSAWNNKLLLEFVHIILHILQHWPAYIFYVKNVTTCINFKLQTGFKYRFLIFSKHISIQQNVLTWRDEGPPLQAERQNTLSDRRSVSSVSHGGVTLTLVNNYTVCEPEGLSAVWCSLSIPEYVGHQILGLWPHLKQIRH